MDTKTSFLKNSPETNFLGNRPRELELQAENKLLVKENNYLHSISIFLYNSFDNYKILVDRMTKAFLEKGIDQSRVFELFSTRGPDVSSAPQVYYHKFEFLDPLFACYDEKIDKLEQTV